MAWNPKLEVAVARDAAKRLDADECIVLYRRLGTRAVGCASYGKTKALCAEARRLGDKCFDTLFAVLKEES